MTRLSRTAALLLTLMYIMMIPALADVPFLIHSAGWTLDETLVDISVTADVGAHMPFDEERLAMLTPITDLLSLRLISGPDGGSVTVAFAGNDLITLAERGNQVQLSCVPGMTFTADVKPMDLLLGESVTVNGIDFFGVNARAETLLTDGETLLAAITDAFAAYGRKTTGKTTVSGMGTAAYRMDYTIPAEDAEQLRETLPTLCPDGWLKDILNGLTFTGKQTLRAYYTQDGTLLRMEYTGKCGPADDQRNTNLIWRMRRDVKGHKDEITLRTPAPTGSDKNNLTFTRTVETDRTGALHMVGEFSYTITKDGASDVRKGEWDLTNAFTDESDVITGFINLRHLPAGDDKYDQVEFEPNLTISGTQDDPVVTGTLLVREKWGKGVREEALLTIDLKRAGTPLWQENAQKISLSAMSKDELAAMQNQVAAAVAATLIRPIILHLGADAAWFFQDLSADQVQSILDAAQAAD